MSLTKIAGESLSLTPLYSNRGVLDYQLTGEIPNEPPSVIFATGSGS